MTPNIYERFDALDAIKEQNLQDLKGLAEEGASKYAEAQKEVERSAKALENNLEDKKLQKDYAVAIQAAQVFKSGSQYCQNRIAQELSIEE